MGFDNHEFSISWFTTFTDFTFLIKQTLKTMVFKLFMDVLYRVVKLVPIATLHWAIFAFRCTATGRLVICGSSLLPKILSQLVTQPCVCEALYFCTLATTIEEGVTKSAFGTLTCLNMHAV